VERKIFVYFNIIRSAVCLNVHSLYQSELPSFNFQYPLVFLRSSSSCLRLLPRVLVIPILSIIFPSIIWLKKAVPTQDVTNPVSLTLFFIVCRIFLFSRSLFISHTLAPKDLLHPPTQHFRNFKAFLTCSSKHPNLAPYEVVLQM